MLIQGHKRFHTEAFGGVQELRDFVSDHRDVILGKPTILLEPGDLERLGCFERTPDFVTVDIVARHWAVIVIEPRGLSPESQAFRSLVKQEQIARRSGTRKTVADMIINQVKTRPSVLKNFEAAGVHAIDVRDALGEVFSQDPFFDLIVEQPSEAALAALTAAAPSFRVWPVRKMVQEDVRENVIYEVPESPRVRALELPAPRATDTPPKQPEVSAKPAEPAMTAPPVAEPVVAPKLEAPSAPEQESQVESEPEPGIVAAAESGPGPEVKPEAEAHVDRTPEPQGQAAAVADIEKVESHKAPASSGKRIGFAGRPHEPAFLHVSEEEIDISLDELVKRGYLGIGERLTKRYRWATGEVSQFDGIIAADGGFHVQEVKNAPTEARGMPEDGMWRTGAGVTLADLKLRYRKDAARTRSR